MNSKPGEQRIKKLITVWRNKALGEEEDPFSKFLFLWICFNAWLAYTSGKDTDRAMINWLVNQDNKSSDLVNCFNNRMKISDNFVQNLQFFAENSPYKDSREKHPDIVVKDENDFENIVEAIYRIRCNLFHGGSEANETDIRRQIALSNAILNEWIAALVVTFNA